MTSPFLPWEGLRTGLAASFLAVSAGAASGAAEVAAGFAVVAGLGVLDVAGGVSACDEEAQPMKIKQHTRAWGPEEKARRARGMWRRGS